MTDVVAARYIHPQGSIITVYDNGAIVKVNPKGKVVGTSATAEKLAAGHGGWTPLTDDTTAVPSASLPVQKAAPTRTLLPMKFREAPIEDLKRFVTDDEWWLQQKLDGIRAQLVFEPGKAPWFRNGTGGQLASDTARPVADKILRLTPTPPAEAQGYTIDGEIIDGAFWIFDLVEDDGERAPLWQRLNVLNSWHEGVGDYGLAGLIKLLPTARLMDEKHALAEAVHGQGGEGWIAKRIDGGYNWGSRVEHSLKLKITHTIDTVVIGRNRKREQNMVLGVYKEHVLTEVGCASAIGKPDTALGDVVEVKYLYAGANGRLVQPTVLRLRTDKPAAECTIDQLRFADKTVVVQPT